MRNARTGEDEALKIIFKGMVEAHRKEHHTAERDVALAGLQHPNIVPFKRVMDEQRWWYISMPLYRRDLFTLLNQAKRFAEDQACTIQVRVQQAMARG